MINAILKKLGLPEKEASLYITLLELGPSLASTLQRKSGYPRTTIYTLLESLKKKGIISNVIQNKTTFFSALDPEILLDQSQKKVAQAQAIKNELEDILPDLKNIQSTYATNKPKVYFFGGVEGIKSIYEDTLNEKENMLIFVTIESLPKELNDFLRKEYVQKRLKKKIKTRAIVSHSPSAHRYKELDKISLRESVILPQDTFPFESEICLYGKDKVAIISFKDDLVGIKIENEALHNTLKAVFCALWNVYKK